MVITREKAALAGMVLAAVACVFLVDWLIKSDKERVAETIHSMADAVEAGDVDTLFSYISTEYSDLNMPLDQLRAIAALFFMRYGSQDVSVRHLKVEISDPMATAQFTAHLPSGQFGPYSNSDWQLDLIKGDDGEYRVTRVVPLRLGQQQIDEWRDLREASGL